MESDLYPPIKSWLETLGYIVKGEVRHCDVVALREGETIQIAICEIKTRFSLELVLQGVERMALGDEIWLAVAASKKGRGAENDSRVKKLCRLLGFGLISVFANGRVEIIASPEAWTPRRNLKARVRLLDEHRKRQGDPTRGGSTRTPVMTYYRQQALACAEILRAGPSRPRDLKTQIPEAPQILQGNVYGWFERIERGVYGLSVAGHAALARWRAISE